jgi:DNA ligase D-like protein (predicted 3'-phosphoesterase)
MSLAKYRSKRSTGRSGEPAGKPSKKRGKEPIFVVQRHDASSLHFDFRLEVDGVLKSWAVPKGPSLDPREKRLAAPTEDHPMAYADFEGRIAEGEYGAGTVIVWDTGTYENLADVSMSRGLRDGHVKFALHGKKLRGAFALTRTKLGGSSGQWLLVKLDDDDADRRRKPERTKLESVLSGKTNDDF